VGGKPIARQEGKRALHSRLQQDRPDLPERFRGLEDLTRMLPRVDVTAPAAQILSFPHSCFLSNNAILAQDMYGLKVEVELLQDAIGVLPNVGDRSHETLDALHSDWWDQRS
jgi:hypothetical protein